MNQFFETVERIWENNFVKALVYLVVAFIAGWIAGFIVKKIFKAVKLDSRLDTWGINEGQNGTAEKFIGKLVFLIVFLLFLPAVLGTLGLETVTKPISDFVATFIGYVPNIIAAAILIFVGIFIGQILSQVITILLAKTKIDNLTSKLSVKRNEEKAENENENTGVKISVIIGKIVNAIVVLIAIVQALTILDIQAISEPALSIISTVFSAIPNIILATLVVALGIVISNIVCGLISNLLTGLNFDSIPKKIMPNMSFNISLTKLVTNVVRVVIIIFVIAEGVEILGLAILTNIMSMIVSYLPMVVKAAIIAIVALLSANLLESVLGKSEAFGKPAIKILKAIIFVVAGFMVLSQLEFATTIVNWAFIITLSALAVAFAIAFGIGGRDFAKKTLENVNLTKKNDNSQNNS